MKIGSVQDGLSGLCPYVSVTINSPSGNSITQTALVDSGSNGYVSLPPIVIEALELTPVGSNIVELANAKTETVTIVSGEVALGRWRRNVPIHQIGDEPTVRTALLRSFNLSIDFVPDGDVRFEAIL